LRPSLSTTVGCSQFLAQDLELEPLLLGGGNLPLQVAQPGARLLEGGAIALVKPGIIEARGQAVRFLIEFGNRLRQRFESVLLLEA
jgi:hypothetical protein